MMECHTYLPDLDQDRGDDELSTELVAYAVPNVSGLRRIDYSYDLQFHTRWQHCEHR